MSKKSEVRIGIFGHYGNENLGDEAIIVAIVQNIRSRLPDAILYGFSINPEDTSKRHNIESFPIRNIGKRPTSKSVVSKKTTYTQAIDKNRKSSNKDTSRGVSMKGLIKGIPIIGFIVKAVSNMPAILKEATREAGFLRRSRLALKKIDILVITGSNQFLDNFGGPWGFPYTLLKWSVLAKLSGKKVLYVSVGAGPINSRLSKYFFRIALLFSDYVSLRDVNSRKLIQGCGYKGEALVYPDLAHSLFMEQIFEKERQMQTQSVNLTVGINPMPMYDRRYWCETDDGKYGDYVNKMAAIAIAIQVDGNNVFLFPTQPKDENVIVDIMSVIDKKTGGKHESITIKTSKDVCGLLEAIVSADFVIATRFHGAVLSLLAECPVLGICYYRKAVDLLQEYGQGNYALELDSLRVEDAVSQYKLLKRRLKEEKAKIAKKNEECSKALAEQYDDIIHQFM